MILYQFYLLFILVICFKLVASGLDGVDSIWTSVEEAAPDRFVRAKLSPPVAPPAIFDEVEYNKFVEGIEIPKVGVVALDYALTKVELPPRGLVLEFGVWQGNSISKIAYKFPNRIIYGFDSFKGLPETWTRTEGDFLAGHFDMEGTLPRVASNVILIEGWFNETLPKFIFAQKLIAKILDEEVEKVKFMHIDCDLYSSTKFIFDTLYEEDMFDNEVVIVFDELINYSTYKKHEMKALYEFLQRSKYHVTWLGTLFEFVKDESVMDFGFQYQSVACIVSKGQLLFASELTSAQIDSSDGRSSILSNLSP